MELVEKTVDSYPVVEICGRLTADCAVKIKTELGRIIETSNVLILDLKDMEYIDSTGLGALVFIMQKLNETGGSLKLVNLNGKAKIVFEITKAYKIFDIFDSIEAVLVGLKTKAV